MNEVNECARLILASGSPRRLDLLRSLGLGFDVIPSRVDEDAETITEPADLVLALALSKARDVAELVTAGKETIVASVERGVTALGVSRNDESPTLVLGADTIVVLDGEILGKPKSHDDACAMLSRLSGRCHQVFTGVAIIELPHNYVPKSSEAKGGEEQQKACRGGSSSRPFHARTASGTSPERLWKIETTYEVSRVYFRKMDPCEIESYVACGEPMDKAGAYALQGTGSAFVERIEGCFTNIIGLPIPRVVQMLRRIGISVLGLP